MEAELGVGFGCQFRLARGNDFEPCRNFFGVEFTRGEIQVHLEMSRLGSLELFVERAHLRGKFPGEQAKTPQGVRRAAVGQATKTRRVEGQ